MRYRFKVSDASGKVRSGHITAVNTEAARKAVESNGYSVLELEPVSGAEPGPRSPRPPRSARVSYQPHLLERLEDLEASPGRRKAVLGGLVTLGALLWLGYRPTDEQTVMSIQPSPARRVRLLLEGAARVPPGQRAKATLHFQMPELPLGLIRDYGSLADESGRYMLDYEFDGQRAPTYVRAWLQVDGRIVDRADKIGLAGEPLRAQIPTLEAPFENL